MNDRTMKNKVTARLLAATKGNITAVFCFLLALSGGFNSSSLARNTGAENSSQTRRRTSDSPSITERIKRVENGLLQPFAIKGQPSVQRKLADLSSQRG